MAGERIISDPKFMVLDKLMRIFSSDGLNLDDWNAIRCDPLRVA